MASDEMAPEFLRLIKAYNSSTKKFEKGTTFYIRPDFPTDLSTPLPSTGFLARLYKTTQGFRLELTSMCPTSPMPKPSLYSAAATARRKACLNLLIAKPPQYAAH